MTQISKQELERLALEAIDQKRVDESLLPIIRKSSTIDASTTMTDSLFRTYRRRLKHTGGNSELLRQTTELVDFLESFPSRDILMITVTGPGGFPTFLLADPQSSAILHWMRMFKSS